MSGVTINQNTGNIICTNETVRDLLRVNKIIAREGGTVDIYSNVNISGALHSAGGFSNGNLPFWIGQSDVDSSLGVLTLENSGYYKLKENIIGSIVLNGANSSLDMSGLSISFGTQAGPVGVSCFGDNINVFSGTIDGFTCGLYAAGVRVNVQDLHVTNIVGDLARVRAHAQEHPLPAMKPATVPAKFASMQSASKKRATKSKPDNWVSKVKPSEKRIAKKHTRNTAEMKARSKASHAHLRKTLPPKLAAKKAISVANKKMLKLAKRTKPLVNIRTAFKTNTPINKVANAAAQREYRKVLKQNGLKPNIGHRNGAPIAGIFIEDCSGVTLCNVSCENCQEVSIVISDCRGLNLNNLTLLDGNRALSVVDCSGGTINNVIASDTFNESDYYASAVIDFNNCDALEVTKINIFDTYKGNSADTFDSNSGVLTVLDCNNVNISDSFITNTYREQDEWSTYSALLLVENNNCNFTNVHADDNTADNSGSDGGNIDVYALIFNSGITFTNCTANNCGLYDARESEIDGWLCVMNFGITFNNCTVNLPFLDNSSNNSYMGGFINVYCMNMQSNNCSADGFYINSDDDSGQITALAIFGNTDSARVNNFHCWSAECSSECVGIDVNEVTDCIISNAVCDEMNSYDDNAIGIRLNNVDHCTVQNCQASNESGYDDTFGILVDDSYSCKVTGCRTDNSYSDDSSAHGIALRDGTYDCVVKNCTSNDNYDCGFLDDSYDRRNSFFGNTAEDNDSNYVLAAYGNIVYYAKDLAMPWNTPARVSTTLHDPPLALPQSTITTEEANLNEVFQSVGTFYLFTDAGPQLISYVGLGEGAFLNCVGGTGNFGSNDPNTRVIIATSSVQPNKWSNISIRYST